ncbi:MAG TPA: SCO family protein [Solirubrobacteraceae bacterium]
MPARVRLALIVFASLVILGAAGVLVFARPQRATVVGASGFAGSLSPPDIRVRDFTLRDQDGHRVSLRRYRGQVVVLTFLYSTCQDTCPLTATTIRGALDQLGHDVPTLAVSVDPAHDTPDSAEAFLVKRGLSAGRMRFLLGTRAQLAPIWHAYGIRPQGKGFSHTATVLVLDRSGRQRVSFPIDQLTDRDLAHDIRRLEAERDSSS